VAEIARGAVGLVKAEFGLDAAPPELIERRKKLCLACDDFDFGICGKCGCYLSAKVRVKGEKCPAGVADW